MAKNYNAGDVVRREMPSVFPEEIVVDESSNSRWKEVSRSRIMDRAKSMVANGQEQPIVVRSIEDNKLQLVSGYTRLKAALQINKLGLMPNGEMFRLDCVVKKSADGKSPMTDEEAFAHSIIENYDRDPTTAVDTARNVNTAIEHFNWTEERVMDLYRIKKADRSKWMSDMKKLHKLPKKIKDKIEDGILHVATGLVLAEIPEDQHEALLEEVARQDPSPEPPPESGPVTQEVKAAEVEPGAVMDAEFDDVDDVEEAAEKRMKQESAAEESAAPAPAPEPAEAPKRKRGRPPGPKKVAAPKKKAITKRALVKAAQAKGLLKGKKVSRTVAGMREFWAPIADGAPNSKLGKLAAAELAWYGGGSDDDHHSALLAIGIK